MMRHRVRITRIIAATLTFALSTQVADAQVMNCTIMGGTHASDDHSGMMQQHRPHDVGTAATRTGGSQNQSAGAAGCNQTMLCATAAAVPATAMRAFHFDSAAPQISFRTGILEAPTLRPDPPPPRI